MEIYLLKLVRHHVSHSPALVFEEIAKGRQKDAVAGLLFLGNFFSNGNQDLHCEQSNAILIVAREVLKQRNHFFNYDRGSQFLDEFGEIVGRLPSYHWCLIMNENAELLTETLLQARGSLPVRNTKQPRS
jgi:hypothetical protein